MKTACKRSLPLLLTLALLAALIPLTFQASALSLTKLADFEGHEKGEALYTAGAAWKEFSYVGSTGNGVAVTITADDTVVADGKLGAKLDAAASSTYVLTTLIAPKSGLPADSSAVLFYLKTPKGAHNFNWTLYGHTPAETAYSYTGSDVTIQLLPKGGTAWQTTTYWAKSSNYGPNLPADFEGYVKLPLSELKSTGTDSAAVDLTKVETIQFSWDKLGGDDGAYYFDAFCTIDGTDDGSTDIGGILNPTTTTTGEPTTATDNATTTDTQASATESTASATTSGTAATTTPGNVSPYMRALQNFEGTTAGGSLTGRITAYDPLSAAAVTTPNGDGKIGVKLSTKTPAWQHFIVPFTPDVNLNGTTNVVCYVKNPGTKILNFTITFEHGDAGYTYKENTWVQTLAASGGSWKQDIYYNGTGMNVPGGFDGYIKLPLDKLAVGWTKATGADAAKVELDKVTGVHIYYNWTSGDAIHDGTYEAYFDSLYATIGTDTGSTAIRDLMEGKDPAPTTPSQPTTPSTPSGNENRRVICDYEAFENGQNLVRSDANPNGMIKFPDTAVAADLIGEASDKAAGDGKLSLRVSSEIKQDWVQGLLYFPTGTDLADTEAMILYVKAPDTGYVEEFNFSISLLVKNGSYVLSDCDVQLLRKGSTAWTSAKYYKDFGTAMGTGFEGFIKFYIKDFVTNTAGFPEKLDPHAVEYMSFWFHNFGGDAAEGRDTAFYLDAIYALKKDDNDTSFVPAGWGEGGETPATTAAGTTAWQGDDVDGDDPAATRTTAGTGSHEGGDSAETGDAGRLPAALAATMAIGACLILLRQRKRHS